MTESEARQALRAVMTISDEVQCFVESPTYFEAAKASVSIVGSSVFGAESKRAWMLIVFIKGRIVARVSINISAPLDRCTMLHYACASLSRGTLGHIAKTLGCAELFGNLQYEILGVKALQAWVDELPQT